MRIDMPTCQYGEDHCRKRFDGNCLLNPDLLDERCPIRRTINDVLEIIDEENNLSKLAEETPWGYKSRVTLAENIKNRVMALKGEQE